MTREAPMNPFKSAVTAVMWLLSGNLGFPRDRVGQVLRTDDGQTFTIYRETTIAPNNPGAAADGAILVFRFHLRFMPEPVRPYAVRVFEPFSIMTTPFFAGLPGFVTKLWCFDHDTGDYMGVYVWDSARRAERYAVALQRFLTSLSIPGSVSYEVVPDPSIEDYLADHTLAQWPVSKSVLPGDRRCLAGVMIGLVVLLVVALGFVTHRQQADESCGCLESRS